MRAWTERPFEVAHLVNPAFTGILLREFAASFERVSGGPPETLLAFIALPIVLHDDTRNRLPASTATRHHVWLEQNLDLRVGFAARCRAVSPHVREVISFAVAAGWIGFVVSASLGAQERSLKRRWREMGCNNVHLKAAAFVGRWFAAAGSAPNLYAQWEVRP